MMKLTPPKQNIFWLSTVLSALALVATFVSIPVVSQYAFWVLLVGNLLLWLSVALKGF
jgi:heme/copper-type cytochrome/quinol oxidase subunit 1